METKVLRSAIEMYPIIFLILTDDSTFLSHKARMFDYSNAHLLETWLALNIVAHYDCVYNRNSKNFKDKHKKSNSWEKVGEKFNLSCLFMNIFRNLRFACCKISSSMSAMLFALIFPRAQRASTYDISAERNVWLQSALRSFAIVCDYMETGLFAIVCDLRSAIVCDPRSSAIVCDHMETSLKRT